jgi:hypothetical protein
VTSPRSREPAATSVLIPAVGTASRAIDTGPRLEGAWAAGIGSSEDLAHTEASLAAPAAWLAASSPAVAPSVAGGGGMSTPTGVVPAACAESSSGAAAGWGATLADTSGRAESSDPASPATSFNRGERQTSSARPESPPVSSPRALLRRESSEAGVTISSEATVGGVWAAGSTERGDLQRRHPATESIGTATAK